MDSRRPIRKTLRVLCISTLVVVGLLFAGGVVAYGLLTGPKDLSRYPGAATSPYRLPWPAGLTWLCVQGNRGVVSHRGREEFAFDFKMPVGSPVCAARGGRVQRVVVNHDGHGLHATNNFIVVDQGDGTFGWYLHLKKDGSLVQAGETVVQGQPIALSGHVGRSSMPHLHFEVCDAHRQTLPISFQDVTKQAGVPRMFFHYTSGNKIAAPANPSDVSPSSSPRPAH